MFQPPDQADDDLRREAPVDLPETSTQNERYWAVAAHLAGGATLFLGPLIIVLTKGESSPFVRRQAVDALNFSLSVMLYVVLSVLNTYATVGTAPDADKPTLLSIWMVFGFAVSRATCLAFVGREYRYPLAIPFTR